MKSRFELNGTMVANEFIDRYMAAANGEYVKVYLYLIRHQDHEVTVTEVADALNHTESDVKRAMAYWTRVGVLVGDGADGEKTPGTASAPVSGAPAYAAAASAAPGSGAPAYASSASGAPVYAASASRAPVSAAGAPSMTAVAERAVSLAATESSVSLAATERAASLAATESSVSLASPEPSAVRIPKQRTYYTPEQVGRLASEEEFTQLLYISQKYMNKVFTPRECEVFAYLYDALHMPVELLEYLVEYCVQGGHYSIRYLETVALNWHERGIRTVDMARQCTMSFSGDAFAVMKAFGLNERRPGDSEMETIRRWFEEWGFSRELVQEACARTLKATHKPSFSYADKILSEWKKAGVRALEDVKRLDEKRESRKAAGEVVSAARKPVKNQFHNFEQRDTDYDNMVLERLKQRLGEQ